MKQLYLVRAGVSQYKIGVASNIGNRIKSLQTSNGTKIELIISRTVANTHEVERKIHAQLAERKLNGGREWFELTPSQALDLAVLINSYPDVEVSDLEQIQELLTEYERLGKKLISVHGRLYGKIDNIYSRLIPPGILAEPKITISKPSNKVSKEDLDNDLINKAKIIFAAEGKGSTSMLQRRLQIGYGRASRLMDRLEEQGIIGPQNGAKAREVLYFA